MSKQKEQGPADTATHVKVLGTMAVGKHIYRRQGWNHQIVDKVRDPTKEIDRKSAAKMVAKGRAEWVEQEAAL